MMPRHANNSSEIPFLFILLSITTLHKFYFSTSLVDVQEKYLNNIVSATKRYWNSIIQRVISIMDWSREYMPEDEVKQKNLRLYFERHGVELLCSYDS